MDTVVLRLAKRIYRATPFLSIRQLYFKGFLRAVRGRRVIRAVDGLIFELDLGEMIDVGVYLGEYEREIVAGIERYCRPGWTILDIGANIGAHTLRFARAVGPEGSVYAFEPTNYAYRKLLRNIELNAWAKSIHAYQIALTDSARGMQPIRVRSSWRSDGGDVLESTIVDFVRLDDWNTSERPGPIQLIKLDVDGNEFEVLSGGHSLLENSGPILFVEAARYHFADEQRNPFRLLQSLRYRFWNSKSLQEYSGPAAILADLEGRQPWIDSINVIASREVLPERAD